MIEVIAKIFDEKKPRNHCVTKEEIIRCKDCRWWWAENNLCTHYKSMDGNICCFECGAEGYCYRGEKRYD